MLLSHIVKRSFLIASFVCIPVTVTAHTVTTKTGCSVSHNHYTACQNGCIDDTAFEAAYGIKRADRVYAGTWAWNCHGRTFNNRGSWINYADTWLSCDAPYCPLNPAAGHAVIWWGSIGKTSHSVTLVGAWNNQSTTIMSKYGAQGQYRHALSKSVLVYGTNWAVTGFGAGTTIYWGKPTVEDGPAFGRGEPGAGSEDVGAQLLIEREQMPWFETVLASEVFYDVERPRLVAQIGGLSDDARKQLEGATTVAEQIDALIEDFAAAAHYESLSAYVSPAHSEDLIAGVEAGNVLVKLAERRPQFRDAVVARLSETLEQAHGAMQDRVRGAALHFLARLVDADERQALVSRVHTLVPGTPGAEVPTYTEYYLSQLETARQ